MTTSADRVTPGAWLVSEFDGTTVYSTERHTGVFACAPDPLPKPPIAGGHHFAPPEQMEERQANARMGAASKSMYHAIKGLLAAMGTVQWSPRLEHAVVNAANAVRYAETGVVPNGERSSR